LRDSRREFAACANTRKLRQGSSRIHVRRCAPQQELPYFMTYRKVKLLDRRFACLLAEVAGRYLARCLSVATFIRGKEQRSHYVSWQARVVHTQRAATAPKGAPVFA